MPDPHMLRLIQITVVLLNLHPCGTAELCLVVTSMDFPKPEAKGGHQGAKR